MGVSQSLLAKVNAVGSSVFHLRLAINKAVPAGTRKLTAKAGVLTAWLGLVVAATSWAAVAQEPFDGNWLVRVNGAVGECRVAYSLAFQVTDGEVVYVGKNRASANGRVKRHGELAVQIVGAGDEVLAIGKLKGSGGAGQWTNAAAGCGGTWTAEKK
jgi:hypothetical protein